MATVPSPSKKPSLAAEDAVTKFDIAGNDHSEARGSFQRALSTEWNDQIRQSALKARFAVSNGFTSAQTPRRALAATRSEPVLSFSNGPSATIRSTFQSSQDTLQAVFGQEYRARELQPMWETSSIASSDAHAHSRSTSFANAQAGDLTRETSFATPGLGQDDDMDGFDPDEAFGTSSSTRFAFPVSEDTNNEDSQGSATTRGTTRTITSRLNKRSLDDDEAPAAEDDDEEMALTDIEDEEIKDDVPRLSFNAPIGRTLAGRRGLSKTQSLPAEVFKGEMSF
ncbi:hypothetical protein OIV83_001753 [Microbotryomycetes sp. JL201]|nr:hypothetical protein OIV83_001753 [Microbotryomycetes sp. JL201]